MPAVVVLALTLALAPTPTPTPAPTVSATPGPLGELVGGVGRIVGDLLGGRGTPTPVPTPSGTRAPTSGPSRPPATEPSRPSRPGANPGPAESSVGARATVPPDRPGGRAGTNGRDPAVPVRGGDTPAPIVAPAIADPVRDGWPPVSYLLVAAVLVGLAVLLLRRRGSAGPSTVPAPTPDPTPPPNPDPGPDNVRRLPTSLNAIYELGRLDERLEQERRRRP
ncbi:hypothetical protein ACIA3K_06675 [Micromonospora sp. NPDC051543]|uniref:hypothetical protein n=1 Tax=Micromonospora sp. NPDC051543 TaxID=3364287 RepID=UPI0037A67661